MILGVIVATVGTLWLLDLLDGVARVQQRLGGLL